MRGARASGSCVRKRVGHRGCAGRRRPKGRFGALRRFGGIGEGGARDWAARVGLRGERGCEGVSKPVAREGRAGRGVGGGGGGPEAARRRSGGREMCLETGDRSEIFS